LCHKAILVSVRDWKRWHRKAVPALFSLVFAALVGGSGLLTDYNGMLPALGGPNGVLYDLTLKLAQPWRRGAETVPAVFVAVDEASLASPDLAALPRAMFQPVWSRLIDGVLDAGARRIAFDVVFAYAGSDFRVGTYALPDYDKSLVESLTKHRDRVVIGRFPGVAPASMFAQAVGAARVAVLDLQVEGDGRARSAIPLVQVTDGRIAPGFAAIAAGLNLRQARALPRILITPSAPLNETPTYSLATLLDCLASPEEEGRLREAFAGRIVVVGTTVPGEDEHRGPTRFIGHADPVVGADRCAPQRGVIRRTLPDNVPGALIQIAAIQSAASPNTVTLAAPWLRFSAGALLALVFAAFAFRDESALTVGESDVAGRFAVVANLSRSFLIGIVGPVALGIAACVLALVAANVWLPIGSPIVATVLIFLAIVGVRSAQHRALFKRLYRTAGRYLPPAQLVMMARSGFAEPPQGEEREVSILIVDIVGFTTFSNQPGRTPGDVVRMANQYFTLMQEVIDRHGGCSDKFLGDAVLAFWNGISDEPEHAAKALLTAHEIVNAVNRAGSSIEHGLSVRAVVCTGRVYVGDLGARQRSNFTIIGSAVNETFRLERAPDMFGLPLAMAGTTAEAITAAPSGPASAQVLANGALVRLDDIELKGFKDARWVYAYVPQDDPGRAAFEAGRAALDQRKTDDALRLLDSVKDGALRHAAKIVAARYRPAP
jgi:class 3 adenylate cyclase